MLHVMSSLHDTQVLKVFWEAMGATFSLKEDGALDVTYSGSLMTDPAAKRDLGKFLLEYARDLHALVLSNGDELAIGRFEFVQQERRLGRYQED